MDKETHADILGKETKTDRSSEEDKEEILLFEEIEIEELAIDGICGVY